MNRMILQNNELKTLQILRAIAATSVVYFHTEFQPSFGTFGVDIFFVISGFVMALVVTTGVRPSKYAYDRLIRIIPLYWILTSCLFVLAAFKPELLNSTTANFTNLIKSILFIPYFKENGALHPMLAVGWTLNYEMFFYFCIWLSILVSRKLYVWKTFCLILLAYILFGNYVDNREMNIFFGNEVLFEFLFGIIAYQAYIKVKHYSLNPFLLFVIGMLSYIFMAVAEVNDFDFSRVFIYGIPSVLVVFSIVNLENAVVLLPKVILDTLVKIGYASYATYLSHFYVVQGCKKILFAKISILNLDSFWVAFSMLIVALIFGQFIYAVIDRPINRFLKMKT